MVLDNFTGEIRVTRKIIQVKETRSRIRCTRSRVFRFWIFQAWGLKRGDAQ